MVNPIVEVSILQYSNFIAKAKCLQLIMCNKKAVVLVVFNISLTSLTSTCLKAGSRLENGSSNKISFGEGANARANATRCF